MSDEEVFERPNFYCGQHKFFLSKQGFCATIEYNRCFVIHEETKFDLWDQINISCFM